MLSTRYSKLNPYVPGEQPKDRSYIKLNANENPYPPSPEVHKVLSSFDSSTLRLYPDPDSNELRAAIAQMLAPSVNPDMIFVGNGSDEVLSFVFYTLFNDTSPLYFPEHTYSFYPVYAGYYGIPYKKIPLNADFSINTEAFLEGKSSGLIFANPNAPTGIFMGTKELRALLSRYPNDTAVVVDEAYVDFGAESAIPLIDEFPNLVIIRTFSKSYCFAGARLGFAVAKPEIIKAFHTTKNSFNHFPVDALTQALGIATCKDALYYQEINAQICATRDSFAQGLQKAGWDVLPSKTNFVLAQKKGLSGVSIYEAIKKQGILVRHFNTPGISNFVRISIGLEKDMEHLLSIMQNM